MSHYKKSLALGCLLAGLFYAVCLAAGGEGSVMSRIRQATERQDPHKQVTAPIPVPKHIVRTTEDYQGGAFYTLTRKGEISRFKCSSCHTGTKVTITNAAAMSHADIKVSHGPKGNPLSCNTCHSQEDRNLLVSAADPKIDFDHVYNMCGQCHFRQKKDWIGGAHGKRVTYWAGKRVVNNCTTCHDPHAPRFEKRWPATYSAPLK
ncbi:MAG TPA: hypothetical protein DHV36_20835 [Desulfobacteraceae bacterium]|nr:hypothetical protein [Desulfobacteraceae bacterium]